jgi:hypothetical protein
MQQRNARRAVGIILNRRHLRRHAGLVALEIDNAIRLLGAAADKTARDTSTRITAASALLAFDKRLLRPVFSNFVAREIRLEAPRRRYWSKTLDGLVLLLPTLDF